MVKETEKQTSTSDIDKSYKDKMKEKVAKAKTREITLKLSETISKKK